MKRIAVMALLAGCGGRDVVITGGGPAQQPAHERAVVYVDGPMFCGKAAFVSCWSTEGECKTVASGCAPTVAAACFGYTNVLLGERAIACAPSVDDCEGVRAAGSVDMPDMSDVDAECFIRRVRR